MKFNQGYYTLNQIEEMVNIHTNGLIHIVEVNQENDQLAITMSNSLRIKIRMT